MSIDDYLGKGSPSWLELESVKRLKVAAEILDTSPDTIARAYPDLIIQLSKRRRGMKLRDILSIANGTARRT